jgi:hypothetical protein
VKCTAAPFCRENNLVNQPFLPQHRFEMMKIWVMAFCCCLAAGRAGAQPAADVVTARSASGQFVALAPRRPDLPMTMSQMSGVPGQWILNTTLQPDSDSKLPLDPFLLVISCERIKEALLVTLGRRDQWRGRITLVINPALPEDQSPVLEGVYDPSGWNYRLTLPSPIEPKLLFRAIVNALLMETANRRAGAQSAELPFWLVAGLSARLQADHLPTFLLRPQSRLVGDRITDPRVDPVRDQLRRQPPLTFQELCWPEAESLAGPNCDLYSACAQLFVDRLLRLQDGGRCLVAMIDKLPQHLNWQTSFLEAFSPHFARLLDVEKWWGLACVHFTDVDFASRFSPLDSWHILQQALDVPVEVHFNPDRLPAQAEITLQEVISTWQPAQAADALQRVAETLAGLRLRIAPVLRPLLERYLAAVQNYLGDTRPDRVAWMGKDVQPQLAVARNTACKELDALDAQRTALRSLYVSPPSQTQLSARGRPPGLPGADQPKSPQP